MFHRILQSKFVSGALFVLVGFLLISVLRFQPALVSVKKELANVENKIEEADKSKLEYERLGEYFKSAAYLELQARVKLNYKKPDEKVVYVYDSVSKSVKKPAEPSPGFWDNNLFILNLNMWLSFVLKN
ncbi:MAG TPA: septum formation initiator family protein [Candidatus Paceibacterota bacterium]